MPGKILYANDGSDDALRALVLALAIAKQNDSELHMVSVNKIGYAPDSSEQMMEGMGTASRRFRGVLQRARAMAEESQVQLHTHVVAGRSVRSVVNLAAELNVELLVIGARGRSTLYGRLVGTRADRIVRHAKCPVLVVK